MIPPLKLGLLGLQGRVGQAILQELFQNTAFVLAKGLIRSKNEPYKGLPLEPHQITVDCEAVFKEADVVIDFTHASTLKNHLEAAVQNKKPFLLGTTGLGEVHFAEIKKGAECIPLLQASNTSMGALILEKIAFQVASLLGTEYDIEIREIHHRDKKDAPSGTALSLGTAAMQGRGKLFSGFEDHRQGLRKTGSVGFSVTRGGANVGEHEVLFMGDGEVLRFSHQAIGRDLFAKGALKGAQWLAYQPPGLYKMADVLE